MNANAQSNKNGFTLIELLVALAIAGLISTAIFAAYNSQEKVHKTQQLVAEMQQNAKAAMLIVSREVRMANAYMGADDLSWKSDISTDKGIDVFRNGIEAFNNFDRDGDGTGDGPDRIDIVYANFDIAARLSSAMTAADEDLSVNAIGQFNDTDSDGDYRHPLILISDGRDASIMEISGVSETTIEHSGTGDYDVNDYTDDFPPAGYPAGSGIFEITWHSFRVDTSDPAHPQLELDPDGPLGGWNYQPMVQDVEDLQVEYVMADGSVINQPDNGSDGNPDNDYDDVRSVRLHIVARTSETMDDFPGSSRPALADRSAGAVDKYQRRVLTEEVKIRNLDLNR